jgi:hypothetical protein
MSWLDPIRSVFRPTPRRCRANAWASVYAGLYDVDPQTRADGGTDDE